LDFSLKLYGPSASQLQPNMIYALQLALALAFKLTLKLVYTGKCIRVP